MLVPPSLLKLARFTRGCVDDELVLAASTEMPLSDIAGLYELRDELLSDDSVGSVFVMLLMVSVATEMEEASDDEMLFRDSGGMPGIDCIKLAPLTAVRTEPPVGSIRPGGRPSLSLTMPATPCKR